MADATPPISTPKPINERMGRLLAAMEECARVASSRLMGEEPVSLDELVPGPGAGFLTVNCTVEVEPGTGVPFASTNTTVMV
jgi:hypothetical protein